MNDDRTRNEPDYAAMSSAELLSVLRDDGAAWAAAFCQIAKTHGHDIDEGWMITWFAAALMRGFDEHAARSR